MGFYRKLREFKGLLLLVTSPFKTRSLPVEFNRYLVVHPPPEELQIRKWEKHLGRDQYITHRLVELVEQNPFHLNQISEIVQDAKTTALLNGNMAISVEDVHEALRRLKGVKNVPVLFGNSGFRKC